MEPHPVQTSPRSWKATEFEIATYMIGAARNSSQAWKGVPGATFKFEGTIASSVPPPQADTVRRVFIQPEPSNYGRIQIRSGWYYLLILPEPPFSGFAYTRVCRDYADDTANIWRSDRAKLITLPTTWDDYDLAQLVYDNDGTAPPIGTDEWFGEPRWPQVDFAFGGHFV